MWLGALTALGLGVTPVDLARASEPAGFSSLGCVDDNDVALGQGPDSCATSADGLDFAASVTVSPDGESLYVTSQFEDAIAIFDRNPATGSLTAVGCVEDDDVGADSCAQTSEGLENVNAVAISPDGEFLYSVSSGDRAIAIFDRNTGTGTLTPISCVEGWSSGPDSCQWGVPGMENGAHSVMVSPDGSSLYAASPVDDAIVGFNRNPSTGALIFDVQPSGALTDNCIADVGADPAGCSQSTSGLDGPWGIAISPTGNSIYVATAGDHALVHLGRSTVTGDMTAVACVEDDESGSGECGTEANGLGGAFAVSVSEDGESVYTAAQQDGAVAAFDRTPATGALTSAGCIDDEEVAQGPDTCGQTTPGLYGARSVAVSPGGGYVYVAANGDHAVAQLIRDPQTSQLSAGSCFDDNDTGVENCAGAADGLNGSGDIAAAAGGYAYGASPFDDAVTIFGAASGDTDPPETQIDSGPSGPTNDATPSFAFSSDETPVTFRCRFDTDAFAPCSGPGDTHTPPQNLAEGAHTFEVKATDASANEDATPASRGFTVDTVAPVPPQLTATNPVSPSSDANPKVIGTSEAGSVVRIYSTSDCTPPGSPAASGTAAQLASPGITASATVDATTIYRATATDAAGNVSGCSSPLAYVHDSGPPDTTIDSGPSGLTNDAEPQFTFSSSEGGASFACRLDAGSFAACSGPGASHTTGVLADGPHTFEVRAIDAAGNVDASPAIRTFTVDATPPAPPLLTATTPDGPANDNSPEVVGTGEPGTSIQLFTTTDCSGPPLATGSAAALSSPGLAATVGNDSTTEFRAVAVDPAGNVSACSEGLVYIERTIPLWNGPIVFTSTRDGNPEIYRMNPDGSGQTRLTNDPGHDDDATFYADGGDVVFASGRDGDMEIRRMDISGGPSVALTNNSDTDVHPAISPNGRKVVFMRRVGGNEDIYSMDIDGTDVLRLTNDVSGDYQPTYSPDGSRIVFVSGRETGAELFVMNADGSGETRLTDGFPFEQDPDFFWQGDRVAFSSGRLGPHKIFTMGIATAPVAAQLSSSAVEDFHPTPAPDGELVAFSSGNSGQRDIVMIRADRTGVVPLTSTPGDDYNPDWGPGTGPDPNPTPPETTITAGPSGNTSQTTPTFAFSSEPGATFQCRLDSGTFGPCSGPGNTHTPATLSPGPHTFHVRAIDAGFKVDPSPATRSFTVVINAAPTAHPQSAVVVEDGMRTITLSGSDPNGDPLNYRITRLPINFVPGALYDGAGTAGNRIDWSELPYTLADPLHRVTYVPYPNSTTPEDFRFSVSDGALQSAEATVSLTTTSVNDPPVLIKQAIRDVIEGDAEGRIVARLTDADFHPESSFRLRIEWGDGRASGGDIWTEGDQTYVVLSQHAYRRFGTYQVEITVTDPAGASDTVRSRLVVDDASIRVDTIRNARAIVGKPWSYRVTCVRDSNPYGVAADLSARINWDDGDTTTGAIRSARDEELCKQWDFAIYRSHTFERAGARDVRTTVTSDGGRRASGVTELRVSR